jgi:hypothetical protein
MLPVLRHLLKQDCLTHAASARLQVACRALAQLPVADVDYEFASACFTDAACSGNGRQQLRITRTAASDADQLQLNRGLRQNLQVPHAAWHPGTDGLLSHAGRLGTRSFAAGSPACNGGERQQSAATSAEAQASDVDFAAETLQPEQGNDDDVRTTGSASAGASASSVQPESDQQSQVSEEAAAAAETRELDEMLQRMTAEAEDMILGGHPQEAIQHLTEGELMQDGHANSYT